MKQYFKTLVVVAVFVLFSLPSFTQEETPENPKTPRWVSDKGYWVVESNTNSPLRYIIWFYNNENLLIYKETIAGVKLNTSKRSVKMKLKKVLEASMLVWEKEKRTEENREYVAAILK
jgi:hypothetical protein